MNNNFSNFFNDGLKEMMNTENFTKYCNPNYFDFSKLSANIKKNSEAIQEASNVAAESIQSMVKRGTEIAQDSAANAINAMKEIATSTNAEQAIARQQQFVQHLVREAVNNTKEMVDTASKSAMEVFDKISKHAHENMSCAVNSASQKKDKK